MSYNIIESILQQTDNPMSAAEAHGIAAGLLCVDDLTDGSAWLTEISCEAGLITEEERAMLLSLFEQTRQFLNSDDFEFDLFLPEQDCPLPERANALKNWCNGFVAGIGAAHSGAEWSGEVNEIVKDVIEFSKLDTDAEGEEDENALVEIIEYLRAAVMLVKQELKHTCKNPNRLH